MAGAGYKLFNTGDVLTAAQVNTYLQEQVVMRFATTTARDTALSGVLAEGMICYIDADNNLYKYTGSAWVNVDSGSTSPLTTKGDLYGFSTADARIPIGTNGHVLTADSSESLGLKWAAPAAGGKVLQVVSTTYSTETTVASTTFTDSGLTLNITPTSASSKVLVISSFSMIVYRESRGVGGKARIMRGATSIVDFGGSGGESTLGGVGATTDDYSQDVAILGFNYLDSPATTSATTYKVQLAVATTANNAAARAQFQSATSTLILMEIGA